MPMNSSHAKSLARDVDDNPALQAAARLGYVVNGLIHLALAWIALQVAFASHSGAADQSGALATLSDNPVGKVVLWVAVVGFAGLGVWQLVDAAVAHHGDGAWKDRLKGVAKGIVYLVLAYSSWNFARGHGKSSRKQSVDFTATLMHHTGGRLLVGAIGVAIIVIGGYLVYKGWKKKFLEDLQGHPGVWTVRAARVGYVAKGVALAIVGVLFVVAGLQKRASEASGLDGALRALREQPFGPYLLTLVALGLAAYGLYSFARARYAKV